MSSSYRDRLVRFYEQHCPEKVAIIDKALESYAGREEEMFRTLVAKYGPEDRTREVYRARLVKFYEWYCPDKLAIVDKALDVYAGREEEMFATLVAKYGPEPGAKKTMTRDEYRARLVLFYECYCPDKLAIVDKALDGYAGREEEMFATLVTKYGQEPTPHEFRWVEVPEKDPVRCRTCEQYFDLTPAVVQLQDKGGPAFCKACWFYLCPKCTHANKVPGEETSFRIQLECQFEVLLAAYIAKDMTEESCQPMVQELMNVVVNEIRVRANRRSFWKMIQGRMNYSSYVDMNRAAEQKYRGDIMETLAGLMVVIVQNSTKYNPPKDLWPDNPDAIIDGSDGDAEDPVEEECLVCLQPATTPVHLSCNCKVTCCANCIIQWLREQHNMDEDSDNWRSCPTCRSPKVSVRTERNTDYSNELYQKGMRLLDEAKALHFNDEGKQKIVDAVEPLTDSIVADPKNPWPYNGLAYMSFLVDDHEDAKNYTTMVLEWIPQNYPDHPVDPKAKAFALEVDSKLELL